MTVSFKALPTDAVRALQAGGADVYGNAPERKISDGIGVPCRHCLTQIKKGEPYLVVAYRPFTDLQPYAETGPLFIHAEECPQGEVGAAVPEMLDGTEYIVRGYDRDERIVYGTGAVTATGEIPEYAEMLLERSDIEFVHIRSASNNCYQCRIERDQT